MQHGTIKTGGLFSNMEPYKLENYVTTWNPIHSCMPGPLARDPIRVQACVCCIL